MNALPCNYLKNGFTVEVKTIYSVYWLYKVYDSTWEILGGNLADERIRYPMWTEIRFFGSILGGFQKRESLVKGMSIFFYDFDQVEYVRTSKIINISLYYGDRKFAI